MRSLESEYFNSHKKNFTMSSFTNATASSGILRSEIPQQCFNEMKTGVYDMLNSFAESEADWSAVIQRILQWSDTEVTDEIASLGKQFPQCEHNFRYTVLKTIKTLNARNGNVDTRIKMSSLAQISLPQFYKDFTQRVVGATELSSQSTFLSLRPSDKEIIARDAFRHTLYAHSHDLFNELVQTNIASEVSYNKSTKISRRSKVNSTVQPIIEPTDSVSQAPSEVVSIRPSKDSRLSESILKLHNANPPPVTLKAGGSNSRASRKTSRSRKSYKNIPPLASTHSRIKQPAVDIKLFSNFSRASKKINEDDVVECEIKTETGKRPRSHFTRSQRASRRAKEPPRFFEEDGIDVQTADVATFV